MYSQQAKPREGNGEGEKHTRTQTNAPNTLSMSMRNQKWREGPNDGEVAVTSPPKGRRAVEVVLAAAADSASPFESNPPWRRPRWRPR